MKKLGKVMKKSGYDYLTLENIGSFLLNPVTVLALLLLLACIAVYTMIDISGVIFLLDQSCQGRQASLTQTLQQGL